MIEGIQPDYGGFDPKYFGVTLRFSAEDSSSWDLFNELRSASDQPAKILEMGNAALKGSTARAFEVFSVASVLLHEVRHFHDFLLSPYGNRIFRLRLMAAINGYQAAGYAKTTHSFVPCPIPAWTRKDQVERGAQASIWRTMLRSKQRFEDYEHVPEAAPLFEQTELAYNRIKDQLHNPDSVGNSVSFQPSHVFEGSAVLAQWQHIYSVFGLEHSELFINVLLNEPSAQPYSAALSLLKTVWDGTAVPLDSALMSAAIQWSLMGDFSSDGWSACPTLRFSRLLDHLRRRGPPAGNVPFNKLFAEWDSTLDVTPVADGFRNNAEANRKLVQKIIGIFHQLPVLHTAIPEVLAGAQLLEATHAHMVSKFLADHAGYVRPLAYQNNLDKWIAAPIAIQFVGGGMNMPKHSLGGLKIHKAIEADGGELMILRYHLDAPTPGVLFVNNETAQKLADLMTLIDFLFAEFKRDDPDFDVTRQVFREEGLLTLEVLQ